MCFLRNNYSNRDDIIPPVSPESYESMYISQQLKTFLKKTETLFCKKSQTENQFDVQDQFRKISSCYGAVHP